MEKAIPLPLFPFFENPIRFGRGIWDIESTSKNLSHIGLTYNFFCSHLSEIENLISAIYNEDIGYSPEVDSQEGIHTLIYFTWILNILEKLESERVISLEKIAEALIAHFFKLGYQRFFDFHIGHFNPVSECTYLLSSLLILEKLDFLKKKQPIEMGNFLLSLVSKDIEYFQKNPCKSKCYSRQLFFGLMGLNILDSTICIHLLKSLDKGKIDDLICTMKYNRESCLNCGLKKKSFEIIYYALACLNLIGEQPTKDTNIIGSVTGIIKSQIAIYTEKDKISTKEIDPVEFFYLLSICKFLRLSKLTTELKSAFPMLCYHFGNSYSFHRCFHLWRNMPLLFDGFPMINVNFREPSIFLGNIDKVSFKFENLSHFKIKDFKFEGFGGIRKSGHRYSEIKEENHRNFAFCFFSEDVVFKEYIGKVRSGTLSFEKEFKFTQILQIDKKPTFSIGQKEFLKWDGYGPTYLNYPIFSFKHRSRVIKFCIYHYDAWLLPKKGNLVQTIIGSDRNNKLEDLIVLIRNEILPTYHINKADEVSIRDLIDKLHITKILGVSKQPNLGDLEKVMRDESQKTREEIYESKIEITKSLKQLHNASKEEIQDIFEKLRKQRDELGLTEKNINNLMEVIIDLKSQVKLENLRVWHFKKSMISSSSIGEKFEKWGFTGTILGVWDVIRFVNQIGNIGKDSSKQAYPDSNHLCKNAIYNDKVQPILISYCLRKCEFANGCEVHVKD